MPGDGLFTGIVSGQDKRKMAIVNIDEVAQVPDASLDVRLGFEAIPDLEDRSGLWHELHEALGAFGGDGPVIKIGLGLDDCLDQGAIDVVTFGGSGDQGIVFHVSKGRLKEDPVFPDPELEFPVVRDIGEMDDSLLVDITVDVCPGCRREQEK